VELASRRPELLRAGYFGSYARGDWGVGSDLDLVVVVESADRPFLERPAAFDTTTLPVPADLLVYTEREWSSGAVGERFAARSGSPVVWVYERPGSTGPDERREAAEQRRGVSPRQTG
jgi:predicted nucleotidyltransferase